MRKIARMLVGIALLVGTQRAGEAGWWIFGNKDASPVTLSYLYLNKIPYSDMGESFTVYREMLPDGKITLKGRARARDGTVTAVFVSLDKGETWGKADLEPSGRFSFSFPAAAGKRYLLSIKAQDEGGKTNDVAATFREVTVSGEHVQIAVKETLDAMVTAYESRDIRRFMNLVSERYAGDDMLLDRAVRKDFGALDYVDIRWVPVTVVSDGKGRVSAAISFNRFVVSTRDGRSDTDRGLTEMAFAMEEGGLRLCSMKEPLLFGLSGRESATGRTNATGGPTLHISETGNVSLK